MAGWEGLFRDVPEWYRDAKFGMFFHWGVYTVPAHQNEWYSRNMYMDGHSANRWHTENFGDISEFGYKDFVPMFTGENFDPEEWANLTVSTGAKFGGPVAEHTDNYSMWDSDINPNNSVRSGPKRDVVGECATAFRAKNLKYLATFHHQWLWGWFMSTNVEADSYNPAYDFYYYKGLPLETNRYEPYRFPDAEFNANWMLKVNEVVNNYRPDIVYFDSRAHIISDSAKQQMLRNYYIENADINGIITYKEQDFPAGTGIYDAEEGFGDLVLREEPWQYDDRLELPTTWCYITNPTYRDAGLVIQELCDIVSKNGTLLLNVGPVTDGSIHPDAITQCNAIGNWLGICGEAIYSTRPWITAEEGPTENVRNDEGTAEDFRFTTLGSDLYAIALGWPEDGNWLITSITSATLPNITSVSLVGGGELTFSQTDSGLQVTAPDTQPYLYAWPLKIQTS